ncbi:MULTISPECIES: hypothetical protein [Amycolatopsis]|uniref:Uncharacterized protein n=1 Tax=Amycolatopsis dendrobii TaxID=2760662 RepID=A0A7W3VVB1_9PSEU|nr:MULTISPECIES: hypothetical protein [Amycolatopsis]MBB1153894.1 hypothetical protein [Amycolatopsis dendrobii]UKD51658.1 hypothetical protein L3Q65_27425 [Amycolatopsis sp. FU40]
MLTGPALPMPGRLRAALGFVILQALLNGVFGVFARRQIEKQRRGGEEPFSILYSLEYLSYAFAAGLVAAGIVVLFGYGWSRWVLLAFEVVSALAGLLNLAGGGVAAAVGLVLAAMVVTTLFHAETKAWFAAKAAQRRAGSTV